MKPNPILLEVFKHRFSSISEEMGVTLNRTAFSPNIKERRDFSCAVFDGNGDMIAQAAHIPVHLGSMPLSVKSAIESVEFRDGDMVILNDPFRGGTHLPDITIVAPVFSGERVPSFYVANRAHHADVGGMTSGSMPLSTTIFQEGIIIPPLKICEGGEMDDKVMGFFLNNVRTPVEREGDFAAQIMANITGVDERNQQPFTYYETLGGGMGASSRGPGESAVHSHMTNTLNTPIEALEYSYPFLVTEYSVRRRSGGAGRYRGGDGYHKEIVPCVLQGD